MVGDGQCDDETNTPGCFYDGGDCCLKDPVLDYCTTCECLAETPNPNPCSESSNSVDRKIQLCGKVFYQFLCCRVFKLAIFIIFLMCFLLFLPDDPSLYLRKPIISSVEQIILEEMKLATNLRNDFENELGTRKNELDNRLFEVDKDGSKFVFGKTFSDVTNFLEAVPTTKKSDTRNTNKGVSI